MICTWLKEIGTWMTPIATFQKFWNVFSSMGVLWLQMCPQYVCTACFLLLHVLSWPPAYQTSQHPAHTAPLHRPEPNKRRTTKGANTSYQFWHAKKILCLRTNGKGACLEKITQSIIISTSSCLKTNMALVWGTKFDLSTANNELEPAILMRTIATMLLDCLFDWVTSKCRGLIPSQWKMIFRNSEFLCENSLDYSHRRNGRGSYIKLQ